MDGATNAERTTHIGTHHSQAGLRNFEHVFCKETLYIVRILQAGIQCIAFFEAVVVA